MAETGAAAIRDRYTGRVAERYEAERAGEAKWVAENAAVETWLGVIGSGTVLDIPVGTGRFLAAYRRFGMPAIGMDVSADMIAQARAKMPDADLRTGDILDIPLGAGTVDVAVAVRIMPWLTPGEMWQALGELARVARRWVITGGGRQARQQALYRAVPGFMVAEEAPIAADHRGDYSLLLLRRR